HEDTSKAAASGYWSQLRKATSSAAPPVTPQQATSSTSRFDKPAVAARLIAGLAETRGSAGFTRAEAGNALALADLTRDRRTVNLYLVGMIADGLLVRVDRKVHGGTARY